MAFIEDLYVHLVFSPTQEAHSSCRMPSVLVDLRSCTCKAAGACVLPQQAPAPDAHTLHQHAAVRRQADAVPPSGTVRDKTAAPSQLCPTPAQGWHDREAAEVAAF